MRNNNQTKPKSDTNLINNYQKNKYNQFIMSSLNPLQKNTLVSNMNDFNRMKNIFTSKAKTRTKKNDFPPGNTKFSRFNSADKYKLSKGVGSTRIADKLQKDMLFLPSQINININNYNFSNYNSSHANQQGSSHIYGGSSVPYITPSTGQSNIIQNLNGPAYIEIINKDQNINSFNRPIYKQSNSNLNKVSSLINSPSDININNTKIKVNSSNKKIVFNRSLQKKVQEMNQDRNEDIQPEVNRLKIGNYEIDHENESFFHEVVNLFQYSSQAKGQSQVQSKINNERYMIGYRKDIKKNENIKSNREREYPNSNSQMPVVVVNQTSQRQGYLIESFINQDMVNIGDEVSKI